VSSTVTRDAEGTVTGNTYDKYGSSNPVVKKLMAGFERTRRIELELGIPPSHYEPGQPNGPLPPTTGAHAAPQTTAERDAIRP